MTAPNTWADLEREALGEATADALRFLMPNGTTPVDSIIVTGLRQLQEELAVFAMTLETPGKHTVDMKLLASVAAGIERRLAMLVSAAELVEELARKERAA